MILYGIGWMVFIQLSKQRKSRITERIPSVILLLILFLAGTLLEAYVNPVIYYGLSGI